MLYFNCLVIDKYACAYSIKLDMRATLMDALGCNEFQMI